ncbi:MAG: transglycosylase domain-containing protein, partial [Proteobacteria bacterium]|nr:transglycosylase domain-containing protein [Pseudomonadota bacterium]
EVVNKLNHLNQKYSLKVEFKSLDIGSSGVRIDEISIAGTQMVIDTVLIQMNFNPFGSHFMKPQSLAIGSVRYNEKVEKSERMDWLKSKIRMTEAFLKLDEPQELKKGGKESSLSAVKRIDIKSFYIALNDLSGNHTEVKFGSTSIDVKSKKVQWKVEHSLIAPYAQEDKFFGSMDLSSKGSLKIKGRSAELIGKTSKWSFDCDAKRVEKTFHCDIDAPILPQSVYLPFQRMLGSSFTPGYKGSIDAHFLAKNELKLSADGAISSLSFDHKSLSVDPVGPFTLGLVAKLDLNLSNKKLRSEIVALRFDIPNMGRSVSADIFIDIAQSTIQNSIYPITGVIRAELPKTSCDDVLRILPRGFASDIADFGLSGDVTADAALSITSDKTNFSWGKLELNCVPQRIPEIYTKDYLNHPFILERTLESDSKVQIPVDHRRDDYVFLQSLPQKVVSAFVSSEDAGFWQHAGIEPGAIEQAFERNTKEGRAVVGGSTITMQLVKNLFLSRDKTISRKTQEIFLAWHLEREIGKKRILELYLNIVEFGPGLYGLGSASKKFFGKSASHLTLKQAVYLASLLPAPLPRYQYFCTGVLTPNYKSLVQTLLDRMLNLGRVSMSDHLAASSEQIVFKNSSQDSGCYNLRSRAHGVDESPRIPSPQVSQ